MLPLNAVRPPNSPSRARHFRRSWQVGRPAPRVWRQIASPSSRSARPFPCVLPFREGARVFSIARTLVLTSLPLRAVPIVPDFSPALWASSRRAKSGASMPRCTTLAAVKINSWRLPSAAMCTRAKSSFRCSKRRVSLGLRVTTVPPMIGALFSSNEWGPVSRPRPERRSAGARPTANGGGCSSERKVRSWWSR